jgi:deoxyadenosine/deoxycytidine kinase
MTESALSRYRHIAIEGPIGAGKTTLARQLAERIGAELLLEQPAENPFLGRFYDDMAGYAFQTQLFFLFQRQKQMQALAQPSMFAQSVVSDFMFEKDALFAKLTLSDDEYRLYSQMHVAIAAQLRAPDLVIWLQATPSVLLARVRRRGVAMEQGIAERYLERLCDAYAEFFESYDGAPVFAVDTEHLDPANRHADLTRLIGRLERLDGRREFFDTQIDVAFD